MSVGWKMKLTKMWHRLLASYLRALAVAFGSLQIAFAAGDVSMGVIKQIGIMLVAGLIAPLIVFITEAADLLDDSGDPPAEP